MLLREKNISNLEDLDNCKNYRSPYQDRWMVHLSLLPVSTRGRCTLGACTLFPLLFRSKISKPPSHLLIFPISSSHSCPRNLMLCSLPNYWIGSSQNSNFKYCSEIWPNIFLKMYLFIREHASMQGGVEQRERERERITSRHSAECEAWCRAQSQDSQIMTWAEIRSRTPSGLGQQGTPIWPNILIFCIQSL